jgi:hypothetical protein
MRQITDLIKSSEFYAKLPEGGYALKQSVIALLDQDNSIETFTETVGYVTLEAYDEVAETDHYDKRVSMISPIDFTQRSVFLKCRQLKVVSNPTSVDVK